MPNFAAKSAPKMNPRDSGPTTASGFHPFEFIRLMNSSVMSERREPSDRTGVMSRNIIPSIGKSGTVRTVSLNFCVISSDILPSLAGPLYGVTTIEARNMILD
jgi:hypothetical protein